jgi:hypothetical protein
VLVRCCNADDLAKLLWLKTSEPLRAAVVACRVCKWLENEMSADSAFSSPVLVRWPTPSRCCTEFERSLHACVRYCVPRELHSIATCIAQSEELKRGAEQIEAWAVGVLDEFTKPDDATLSLTGIPARQMHDYAENSGASDSDGTWHLLWPHSVIDTAANKRTSESHHPCRRVIAHHHCQHVVQLYFLGVRTTARTHRTHKLRFHLCPRQGRR